MTRPRIVRKNLDDPATMAHYLRTGVVWRMPMLWPHAMRAIRDGLVPLSECKDVPEQVRALLEEPDSDPMAVPDQERQPEIITS